MRAIGDQRWAIETAPGASADLRGDLVADKPDDASGRQRPEVVDLLRVDQALDRLPQRHAGADEDGGDDEVAGALLGLEGAQ